MDTKYKHFYMVNPYSILLYGQPNNLTSVSNRKTYKIRGPGFTSKSSEKSYISSTFTLSFMCFSQRNYVLNMSRIAKHFRLLSAFSIISSQNFIIKKILKYCIIFYPVSETFHFFKNFIPLILRKIIFCIFCFIHPVLYLLPYHTFNSLILGSNCSATIQNLCICPFFLFCH